LSSLEEKRSYALEDSLLLYQILAKNSFEVLKLMESISTLTNAPFDICPRAGLSKIWSYVVDRYIEIEIEDLYRNKNNYTEEDLKSRISILNEYIDRDVYSNNNNDDDNNDEIVIEPKENDGEEKQEDKQEDITTEQQHHHQQHQQQEVEQMKFEGGKVFEIVPGEYKNICDRRSKFVSKFDNKRI
jgi:hypothetical protein